MSLRTLNFILTASLACLILVGLWLVRRPLCIDSTFVERIDRVSATGTERVWACRYAKQVPYSPDLAADIHRVSDLLSRIEKAMLPLGHRPPPLAITIWNDRPFVFRLHQNTLFIGDSMLKARGHLERGLIKAWIRHLNNDFGEGDLREEVLTDLVLHEIFGDLDVEDPLSASQTSLKTQWPTVILNEENYCASPWRLSEHYELCQKNKSLFHHQVWLWSLRPLISDALIKGALSLTLIERTEAMREFKTLVRKNPGRFHADTNGFLGALRTLSSFVEDFSRRAPGAGPSSVKIAGRLQTAVGKTTLSKEKPQLEFDFLVSSDQVVKGEEGWLKSLVRFALDHPERRLGVRDPQGVIFLPGLQKAPLDAIPGLKSGRLAVLHCEDMSFEKVLSFQGISDKVLFLSSCDSRLASLQKWAFEGVEAFARAERKPPFVQVHLPSLVAKKGALDLHQSLYSIRFLSAPSRIFGWQEVQWIESANAYRTKASLDAIEWFRMGQERL